MGLFDRFKKGLEKSRTGLWGRLSGIFSRSRLDESAFEEMEEALLAADVGVDTSVWLVEQVRRLAREQRVDQPSELPRLLAQAMASAFEGLDSSMHLATSGPTVVLVVGVNGVGKTTTIAKLAHFYRRQGKQVLLAAGDTFRAAAIDQLLTWGQRVGCDVIRHRPGADAAAVLYDALQAAQARGADMVLCDTAGRLHNKAPLMAELSKMYKVAQRELPGAPHEVLLVVDGTTGQNALNQARTFREAVQVTGIAVTKLDGTAKGGVILPIVRELRIPVKWVGLGEKMDDLEPFDPAAFSQAICEP
ncbi:MAG: signal recognition particle-docking protein FtsY [Thermoflavifilum sp.]|nr:signal recognition particle-docking protein FtsY [Thermoflavifilum sp.]MCL6513342.1 signal recognition particle-docking protein FtsY [Alicyclobacillus sp.]